MLQTLRDEIECQAGVTNSIAAVYEVTSPEDAGRVKIEGILKRDRLRLQRLEARLPRIQQLVDRHAEYAEIEQKIAELVQRRSEILEPLEQAMYKLAQRGDELLIWL
jgi:acyl carrier protein phosphodiesterase